MTCLLLFYSLIIFSNYIQGYDEYHQGKLYDSDEYDYTFESNPDEDVIELKAEISAFTTPKSATYEVTEIVIDVPNTSTKSGPVVPNFTTKRPLNLVTPKIKNLTDFEPDFSNNKENYSNDNNDSNIKAKKNSFTIFHVNAEYDDKPSTHIYHGNLDTIPHRPGFKEYLYGIKKGIVNGFNKIFHRHGYGYGDHGFGRKDFGDSHEYQKHNSDENEEIDHMFRHDIDKEFN